jgi:hypothetical protein
MFYWNNVKQVYNSHMVMGGSEHERGPGACSHSIYSKQKKEVFDARNLKSKYRNKTWLHYQVEDPSGL